VVSDVLNDIINNYVDDEINFDLEMHSFENKLHTIVIDFNNTYINFDKITNKYFLVFYTINDKHMCFISSVSHNSYTCNIISFCNALMNIIYHKTQYIRDGKNKDHVYLTITNNKITIKHITC
jgi:hypothetical protein